MEGSERSSAKPSRRGTLAEAGREGLTKASMAVSHSQQAVQSQITSPGFSS